MARPFRWRTPRRRKVSLPPQRSTWFAGLVVTIRGVDVFDPTTGAVRTGDVDDIACWFIDTDYDGQSFFVRHAYFLYGGKDTKEGTAIASYFCAKPRRIRSRVLVERQAR